MNLFGQTSKDSQCFYYTDQQVEQIAKKLSEVEETAYESLYEGGIVKFVNPKDRADEIWFEDLIYDSLGDIEHKLYNVVVLYPSGYQYFQDDMAAIVVVTKL